MVRRLAILVALTLLVGAGFVGYTIGTRSSGDSGKASLCVEVIAREKELSDLAAAIIKEMPTGGLYEEIEERKRDQRVIGGVLEERAILVGQNPTCFSPTDRATIEAQSRQWNATFR